MVAHAFWKLKNEYPNAAFEQAVEKARMYFISYQEEGTGGGQWLRDEIPEAQNILDHQFVDTWNYRPRSDQPYEEMMGKEWLQTNVTQDHGPLGSEYYWMGEDELYVSEGDTPSFLWIVDNGLRSHERPDFGGWGGRHRNLHGNQWGDATDDGDEKKPMWRWVPAVQNDWAARLDWCVMSPEEANHTPDVIVDGPLDRTVSPGETVTVDASASTDPDGDDLTFLWWQYADAGTTEDTISIENQDAATIAFDIPQEPGTTLHLICEVTDTGEPPLTRYQRIIFSIE